MPAAVEAQSPNHWTPREVPSVSNFKHKIRNWGFGKEKLGHSSGELSKSLRAFLRGLSKAGAACSLT